MSPAGAPPTRPVRSSVGRGLRRRCPACGEGRLFAGYLKIADHCPHCGAAFGQIRADDIPPYVTILIVGHIVVPLILLVYQNFQPPTWLSMTVWPLLTLALTLLLLPLVKGGIVGLMWCLRLRGDEMH
ncbi:MAG: DUF983 domain-containing protein [Alphaproteobacteria bacterium]